MLLLFFSCLLVGFRSKSQRFGIGLAAAIAPEVKGVGWAVAAAFPFADAAAGPCWSRGAWGWLPPSPLVMLRPVDDLDP